MQCFFEKYVHSEIFRFMLVLKIHTYTLNVILCLCTCVFVEKPDKCVHIVIVCTLQEMLEECRTQHNNDNQQLETRLDVVLAMMREGSTDEVDTTLSIDYL